METNGKRVFVLGAGASHGSRFDLPMMDGFFEEDILGAPEFAPLAEFLRRYTPDANVRSVNLEDVMSHLVSTAK